MHCIIFFFFFNKWIIKCVNLDGHFNVTICDEQLVKLGKSTKCLKSFFFLITNSQNAEDGLCLQGSTVVT